MISRKSGETMQVLSNNPSGTLVLNPPDLVSFVSRSPLGSVALVLKARDLVVNTGYTCHNDMMAAAGMQNVELDLEALNLDEATFRGGMNSEGVSFDIWNMDNRFAVESHQDALRTIYRFLSGHRRLAKAPPLTILVFDDDYVLTHIFDEAGLVEVRHELPEP